MHFKQQDVVLVRNILLEGRRTQRQQERIICFLVKNTNTYLSRRRGTSTAARRNKSNTRLPLVTRTTTTSSLSFSSSSRNNLRFFSSSSSTVSSSSSSSSSSLSNKKVVVEEDDDDERDPEVIAGLFKNPIVHQLWTARQKAKNRRNTKKRRGTRQQHQEQPDHDGKETNTTTLLNVGKTTLDSRVEVSYEFSTNEILRETYQNPYGQMRFGRIMEDLDALAGNIAFFHVDNPDNNNNENEYERPVLVTASVDRIKLSRRPSMGSNQYLSGQVSWTGTSSMEIKMTCRDDNPHHPEWLDAYVTFVTLDPKTKRPAKSIPQIIPQTLSEQVEFDAGSKRAAIKKKRRKQHKQAYTPEIDDIAKSLLQEAGPLINMPSLADTNSILMSLTRLSNAMIAQPQVRNLHDRIFGGYLMRTAFELAYSCSYIFAGSRPIFLEVDDVSFNKPVSVGDLLVFHSRILYTEQNGRIRNDFHESVITTTTNTTTTTKGNVVGVEEDGESRDTVVILSSSDSDGDGNGLPLIHVEVEAWVTEPEKATAYIANQFHFTFAVANNNNNNKNDDDDDKTMTNSTKTKSIRRVLPANIDEARRIAIRMLADKEQEEE